MSPSQHYAVLDLLRGFAAISVVGYHLGHWLGAGWLASNSNFAVDLFYALSGFVLAHAYAGRIDELSLAQFAGRRLARLLPVIVLATVISAAYVVLRAYAADPRSHVSSDGVPVSAIAVAIFLGGLNLPYFNAPVAIGGPQLFPLNGPQYTLFFEVFVNLLWWSLRRLPPVKTAVVSIAICLPLSLSMGLGGAAPDNFLSGFPRVILCFQLGVLAYHFERSGRMRSLTPILFTISGLTTLAIFYAPVELPREIHFGYILLVVPVLIVSGARLPLRRKAERLALLAGALSYPIYALHYPVFAWVNGLYRKGFGDQNILAEGPLVVAAVIVLSVVALKVYDAPIRAAIRSGLRSRTLVAPARSALS